jgi:hypothetical protein
MLSAISVREEFRRLTISREILGLPQHVLVNTFPSEQKATSNSGVKVKVYSQVWIAVISSFGLGVLNIIGLGFWNRHEQRKLSKANRSMNTV